MVSCRLSLLLSCLCLLLAAAGHGSGEAPEPSLTVARARKVGSGGPVRLVDKVVTAGTDQMAGQAFFYVQEAGTGIRVRSTTVVCQGDRVTVEGTLRRTDDDGASDPRSEPEVRATSVTATYGPNKLPAPSRLTVRQATAPAAAGKVGSYVEVRGKVVSVDGAGASFRITEGSRPSDGPARGLRVLAPPGVAVGGLLNRTITLQGILGRSGANRVLRPCPEKLLDLNLNGFWDRGEPFVDINGNGTFDGLRVAGVPGPSFISRFDRYGTLILRGKPLVPKGLYCYDVTPGTLDAAAAQGFNVVQHHGLFADSLAALRARGLVTFPLLTNPSDRDAWLAAKDDPAIAGWYLHDEPEWHGITPAQALADFRQVKGRDPGHVVGESHADLKLMGGYAASDEVAWMDRYPVGNASGKFGIPTIWDFDWTYRAAQGGTPYYPVWQYVQMFQEAPHFTLPTVAQLRAMVFLGLASHVKGFFYFSYQRGGELWQALWAEARALNRQMDTLRPFLVLPWTPLEVTTSNPTWVRAGGYRVGNSALLVVVNGDDTSPQTATISLPGVPDNATLSAPLGGPEQKLSGRAFTHTLAPCEARVLMYGRRPALAGSRG